MLCLVWGFLPFFWMHQSNDGQECSQKPLDFLSLISLLESMHCVRAVHNTPPGTQYGQQFGLGCLGSSSGNIHKGSCRQSRWCLLHSRSFDTDHSLPLCQAPRSLPVPTSTQEGSVHQNFPAALAQYADLLLFGTLVFCPPLFRLATAAGLFPRPGSGPTAAQMDEGYVMVTGRGTGDRGSCVQATLYSKGDPGCLATAHLLVEAGLALLDPAVSAEGGVWSPAACQGMVLLRRLEATGWWYGIE